MRFVCFAPNCSVTHTFEPTVAAPAVSDPGSTSLDRNDADLRFLPCSVCNLARYCSVDCAKTHTSDECRLGRSNATYKTLASFLSQAQNQGWSHCVRQMLSMPATASEADIHGCWTAAFAMARAVGGNEAVEVLCAKRMNMESMMMGMNWTEDKDEIKGLRDNCVQRCAILQEMENPVPLICWFMPGENYMFNSPHREETQSYDHVFAVVPFCSGRVLLLQSIDSIMCISVVNRRLFWTDVRAVVSSTRWSSPLSCSSSRCITACYKRAFGVERDFNGREMAVLFDATPLVSAECAMCGCETAPKHCARCKRAIYCSRSCQQMHWSRGHKEECKKSESTEN